jgi:hypothetical protein
VAIVFLIAVIGVCAVAAGVDVLLRRRHSRVLAALGGQWAMRYSAADVLGMGTRLQQVFPVPGAADLRVGDLMFRREADQYRYLLTVEYTRGVTGGKRRLRQVVTFTEPCNVADGQPPAAMELAPENLPIVEQYEYLIRKQVGGGRV